MSTMGLRQHHNGIKDDFQTKLGFPQERGNHYGGHKKKYFLSLQKGFWNDIYSSKMPLISKGWLYSPGSHRPAGS